MIGWVPQVMVGFFDQIAGIDMRKAILEDAGLDPEATEFRLDTDVPDPACRRIVEAACKRLGVTENQAFALFAPYFLKSAHKAFPGFFRGVVGTRDFLLRQPAIHNCIAAGQLDTQRQAVADKFRVEATTYGLRLYYNSPNKLVNLYIAIANEMATGNGESAKITFESGDPETAACTLHIEIARAMAKDDELVRVSG